MPSTLETSRHQTAYELGAELGQGAYGKVYRAVQRDTGKEFALKRIPRHANTDGIPQSVIREIATLASLRKLNHPNLTTLVEALVSRGAHGEFFIDMVMELCRCDLGAYLLARAAPLPEQHCRLISRQTLKAIDFLHVNGIIHRDIKTQNILLTSNGVVKLADFGLARQYELHCTYTPTVVTLNYRSPELLLQCTYSTAVDIWSVGCVMAELYRRRPLFNAQTEAQQLNAIFEKLGVPASDEWPQKSVVDHSFYAENPRLNRLLPEGPHGCDLQRFDLHGMPVAALDLLRSTLSFAPHLRPTAAECLRHSYFRTAPRVAQLNRTI